MKNRNYILIPIVSLILNLIWEFSHQSLYVDLSGIPSTWHLILASLWDMVIVSSFFSIVSLKNKGWKWIERTSRQNYLLLVLMGIVVAVLIEITNLKLGRWIYTENMPLMFGIGTSPLFQLAVTSLITLLILKNQIKKSF